MPEDDPRNPAVIADLLIGQGNIVSLSFQLQAICCYPTIGSCTATTWRMAPSCCNECMWHAGLSGILRSENNKRTRGDLRKEFLVSCSEDLFALFRCMGQSEIDANCCISDSALHDTLSQLHVTVTKMHGRSGQIHTLIEALLSLCTFENVFIVGRSLRVLHSILRRLLSCEVLSNRK